ncbi:hypothetical protein ACWGR4_20675 [Embleya sp. NPDC055664]
MTYLDPGRCDLVRADWPGPARITGPAGTGKTVVGLHRAAYLAQHGAGRVLYVAFTANLPRVQRTFPADPAPVAVDRVDFHTIHSWALRFLDEHDARPPASTPPAPRPPSTVPGPKPEPRRRLFIAMVRARDTLWLGHVTPASSPNPPTPPSHPTRPIR